MIYILFPTAAELGPLARLIDSPADVAHGRRRGMSGTLAGRGVTAVVSGVGQANTAQAMTALLERADADMAILGGCAGAYPGSGLNVGDVALATRETCAELGVRTPDGFLSMAEIGLPILEVGGTRYFDTFDLPAWPGVCCSNPLLLAGEGAGGEGSPTGVCCKVASAGLSEYPNVLSGPFLTVSTVSGTAARGRELFARFGAIAENMEGAAAAQVAALYGVPFAEVRGISNKVEDRNRDAWDIPQATANCAAVIERIVALL